MISRIEFLFPAQAPNPASPEYLRMIREIGDQNRWTEWPGWASIRPGGFRPCFWA